MPQHAEQLERQHRQHAGHQVEDQPAQQSQSQNRPERPARRIQRPFEFRRQGWKFFHEPGIIDCSTARSGVTSVPSMGWAATSSGVAPMPSRVITAYRPSLESWTCGSSKKGQRRAFGEKVRPYQRAFGLYRHAQAHRILDGLEDGLLDGNADRSGGHRNPRPVAVDHAANGVASAGPAGISRVSDCLARDAYFLAGKIRYRARKLTASLVWASRTFSGKTTSSL